MGLQALAALLAFAIGALLFLRARPHAVKGASPVYRGREWLIAAVPLAFAASMQILNSNIDIIMLGFFEPAEQLGVYRAVVQTSTLVGLGLMAVNPVVAPQFSRLYAQGDQRRLQRVVIRSARLIAALTIPVAVVMIFFGDKVLSLVFGPAFSTGYVPLVLLTTGELGNALFGSVATLLNMSGHESRTARGVAIAAGTNVVLNLLLIPSFGLVGAATATAISTILWNSILWWDVRRHVGINSLAIWRAGPRD
jgi:O-antigen/teichoic acid export membrane protein